jgi:hypothetical protein
MAPARTLSIRSINAGFAANFNLVLCNLDRWLGKDGVRAAEVLWRVSPDARQFAYGARDHPNPWLHYFEPLPFADPPTPRLEVKTYPRTGAHQIVGKDAYAVYKIDPFWRRRYSGLYSRFVRPRPFLVARADAIFEAGLAGVFRLGVHYRNPRHGHECLDPIPPPEAFIARARRILAGAGPARVFLASDYQPAVDAFEAAFGSMLVVQPAVQRATAEDHDQVHHVRPEPSFALGEQVLVDCLLLARCEALLHVTSNVATAAAIINPRLKLIYCETPAQAARGYVWALWRLARWWARPLRPPPHKRRPAR